MRTRIFFLVISLLFLFPEAFSQPDNIINYVRGDVLIQLKSGQNSELVLKRLRTKGYDVKQIVSQRFGIYLLGFDYLKQTNAGAIKTLKAEKAVINVQNNHFISLRETGETIPDDSYFPQQWSLRNTGQNSGTVGADIDATDAWDITTGGLSADGDTIVIAIIDSGSDIDHIDMDFWKNTDEIPDNGIDDDNNGYVDDYNGWNAFMHKDEIIDGNHGIHVSGIAAATGNNNYAITGINWGAKVLPVIGSSTNEAIVVEALSYVYTIRETYNLTNGEKGAFIVADNCSFGVDQGQPEDYPIWEAMYDSLGRIGVISVGATANHEWDIDELGDIPSSFTTDYLIAVTNTTNKDRLYPFAAWGDTTIDLGAPGTQIKSLFVNSSVGNKTGTSMAAPHVTGSVALLFAGADQEFIQNYKANPGDGALAIKHHILQGVDPIDDLTGKTVSDGRLNVFNSMNLLLDAPVLHVDKDSVLEELSVDTQSEVILNLSNSGTDSLGFSINFDNNPQWLSSDVDTGIIASGEAMDVILYFDNATLDTGYYQTIMTINGPDYIGKNLKVIMHVYDGLSISHNPEHVEVVVFPNPFNDYVSFVPDTFGETEVNVYDLSGKLVFKKTSNINSLNSNIVWRPDDIPQGIYFYSIKSPKGTASGKIIRKAY